jgi:glycosyltransferase involved in cell wall biosynthesis
VKKNNRYEVSVVIPCYNSEKYIEKTLDSICNQTFKNYEIICVNDGSTDGTLDILKKYEKEFKNFIVISKENDRGATTIKTGLKEVSGKYVCVIDNDDYVSPNYIEELYNTIESEHADIAVCGFQREDFETRKVISREMNNRRKSIIVSDDYGKLLEINTSLWNKMFKSNLIKKVINVDNLFGMDMIYLAYIYPETQKIAFNEKILYYYQIREKSSINNLKIDYIKKVYDSLLIVRDYYNMINSGMIEFLSCYVFLHVGVSLLYRMYNSSDDFNSMYRKNTKYLNINFPLWLKNRYCNLRYVIFNKGTNFKLYICKLFYKFHLFKLFLFIYSFFINKFNIDIKW